MPAPDWEDLNDFLDEEEFATAVEVMQASAGHVVVCGMGKSGIIGRKISASLASTGTPSLFLHPAEAIHGDRGADQLLVGGWNARLVAMQVSEHHPIAIGHGDAPNTRLSTRSSQNGFL